MATGRPVPNPSVVVAAVVLALTGGTARAVHAQTAHAQARAGTVSPGDEASSPGVSLGQIRRLLRDAAPAQPSTNSSLLKVEYHVEVVGKAPRIDLFRNFDIGRGTAVQYGGMTHDELLRLTAPWWRRR
jgi:hypothetical protein